jgi:hypothetical protein
LVPQGQLSDRIVAATVLESLLPLLGDETPEDGQLDPDQLVAVCRSLQVADFKNLG